jgi:dihydrofolate reductase
MSRLRFGITVSLDGYVAGPHQSKEEPLGRGGEGLHQWVVRLKSWRESHGMEGGADVANQYLAAGLIDDMELHVVPVLLGGGARLFASPAKELHGLEPVRAVLGEGVVHLRFAR